MQCINGKFGRRVVRSAIGNHVQPVPQVPRKSVKVGVSGCDAGVRLKPLRFQVVFKGPKGMPNRCINSDAARTGRLRCGFRFIRHFNSPFLLAGGHRRLCPSLGGARLLKVVPFKSPSVREIPNHQLSVIKQGYDSWLTFPFCCGNLNYLWSMLLLFWVNRLLSHRLTSRSTRTRHLPGEL